MARLCVVPLLAMALLAGCAKPRQSTVATPPAPAPSQPVSHASPVTAIPAALEVSQLQASGAALEQIIGDPANAIPDSLLNRTVCFVISLAPTEQNGRPGFATCRNQSSWTSPVVLRMDDVSGDAAGADLLLLLVSERAVQALYSGSLEIGSEIRASAGPIEKQHPTFTADELRGKDILGYSRRDELFRGFALSRATVTVSTDRTQRIYEHRFEPKALLKGSTYSSSVTNPFVTDVNSFFNTITPVGIIIHHSVLIPAHDLPDAERALDRFHYKRGFAISCFGKTYHIAYHYLILPNGEVQSGRPERCQGAHARGYNSYLGIALVGDFSSRDNPHGKKGPMQPTAQQMDALVKLCRELREKYDIPIQRIMPHSEVSRTRCPGDRFHFKLLLAELETGAKSGQ